MERRSELNLKSELAAFTLRCVLFAMSTVHNRLHYVINNFLPEVKFRNKHTCSTKAFQLRLLCVE